MGGWAINRFKDFLSSYWLTYTTLVINRLFAHQCTALIHVAPVLELTEEFPKTVFSPVKKNGNSGISS